MTIQLTAPILEAGVEQAVGTQLTLGADREAELVNRGVAVYTSRSLAAGEDLVQIFGRRNPAGGLLGIVFEGTSYAAIPLDVNGNAIANVNHRRGTLAALKGLTLGIGELAVISDFRGFFVGGAVGQAVLYGAFAPLKRAIAYAFESVATCTAGAAGVVLPLDGSLIGTDTYDLDGVNYTVSGVPGLGLNKAVLYEVQAEVNFAANATGTRTVELQRKIGAGAWSTVKSRTVAANATGGTDVHIPPFLEQSGVSTSDYYYRLLVSSTGATVDALMTHLSVTTTPIPNAAAA